MILIDGINIYTEYGIITTSGNNDLLVVASIIEPESIDWPEQDGLDVDLSEIFLDNKNVSIGFACVSSDNVKIDNFLAFLTRPGYRHIYSEDLDRTYILRVNSETNREVYNAGQPFTIQLIDDFPLNAFRDQTQRSGHGLQAPKQVYHLDGISLNEYGLTVLEGSEKEVYKMPELKENLAIKSNFLNGIRYDADFVRFKAKDVALECAFYCDTIERFNANYNAFFSDLIKPELRQLYIEYAYEEFSCYYKSTSNFDFIRKNNVVACKFTLTLTFTSCRPKESVYVWGSQNNRVIMTEDSKNAIIYK